MSYEIDLRSLLVNNLKCENHDVSPYTIYTNNEENIIDRPFDTFRRWSKVEQTSYIESIFLKCSLQPIIRFVSNNHTIIIDGENRYNAIMDFCNNNLLLNDKGLKQLKFLVNKNFKKLSDSEKEYFKKSDPIRFFDYSYNNPDKVLSDVEEYEIVRYLHYIYNMGLRLEKEEMQKAQFHNDYVTKKIRDKIINDITFLDKLENQRLFNGHKKKNRIENILLNCRLLIASTYSNIENFASIQNIQDRVEQMYLPNINECDKENIFQEFCLNIDLINNKLITTQKWELYPQLHTKPFLDVTYWLISVIRKDKICEPLAFDFMKYLEYFGEKEERSKNFEVFQSHYKVNIIKRYKIVAQYFEDTYGYDMKSYFKQEINKNISVETINSVEDLYTYRFSFHTSTLKISTLLNNMKNTNFDLRPIYQRNETMNISMSSKIIESILLQIKIPFLLFYNHINNGRIITEVVDGQQRMLSLLAFFQQPFSNVNGELEYSLKNGYSLKDLKILYELNGYSTDAKSNRRLKQSDINMIMDTELYVSTTSDDNNSFSAIDHFIRLNKNAFTIKDNSYRMWSLTADRKILEYERNITNNFINKILPQNNQKRTANIITLRLACLFYNNKKKKISRSDYSNYKVSSWLDDFSKQKNKYLFCDIEKIYNLRNEYLYSLDNVNEFYLKLDSLLNKCNLTIRDLLVLKKRPNISIINYYYLFVMLENISNEDLLNNSAIISKYIISFFEQIKLLNNNHDRINEILNYLLQQISIFDTKKQLEFKEILEQAIELNK